MIRLNYLDTASFPFSRHGANLDEFLSHFQKLAHTLVLGNAETYFCRNDNLRELVLCIWFKGEQVAAGG